jgi:hypothetical protein
MPNAGSFQALDDQRFSGFHWRAVLTTGLGVFTDFYDNTTIGMVLPMVLASFGIAHVSGLQAGAVDRIGRRWLQAGGLFLGAIMLLLFVTLHDVVMAAPALGMLFLGVYSFALNGPNVVTSFLGAELSPTRVRTVGQSFSVLGGRIGASTSAFLFPFLFMRTGLEGALMFLSLLAIAGAALTMILVPETKRRSLEDISREMELAVSRA